MITRVAEAELSDLPPVMLAALAEVIPVHHCCFYEVDPLAPDIRLSAHPPGFDFPEAIRRRSVELLGTNPLAAHFFATGDGSARRISDLMTPEEYRLTPFHAEVTSRLGSEHQMAFTLSEADPLIAVVVMSRCDEDFSDDERDLCNLLRPPLAAVLRAEVRRAMIHEALVSQVANMPRSALLAFDSEGLLALDDPGEHFVSRLTDERARIVDPLAAWVSRVIGDHTAFEGNDPDHFLTTSTDAQGTVEIRYVPGPQNRHLLLVRQVEPRIPAVLRSLGLRPREADVLDLAMSGFNNDEIARTLGITIATVKKHLEGIYRTLRVSTRTAAVVAGFRALSGSVPGPDPRGATSPEKP